MAHLLYCKMEAYPQTKPYPETILAESLFTFGQNRRDESYDMRILVF